MKKKLRSALSMLLCTIMIFAMIPMTASAEVVEYEDGSYGFSTFEDLKEIIPKVSGNEGWCGAFYQSSEPLVIKESISIPASLSLYCEEATVIVPEGVTLTLNGEVNYFKELTIDGTVVSNQELTAYEKLTVNGNLTNNGWLRPGAECEVVGFDNITFGKYGEIWWTKKFTTFSQMKDYFELAEANPKYTYDICADYNVEVVDVHITEDVEIPENARLYGDDNCTLTVDAGCTLTNNNYIGLNGGTLVVNGTLDGTGDIQLGWICYEGDQYVYGNMVVGSTGTYDSKGYISVHGGDRTDYSGSLSGLDFSLFNVETYGEEGSYIWELRLKAYAGSDDGTDDPVDENIYFYSFEEMQDVFAAAAELGNYGMAYYMGEEPLVISESITVPENLDLNFFDTKVTVPEGVTFTLDGMWHTFDELVIDGTVVNNTIALVNNSLTINGTLQNNDMFIINTNCEVVGIENAVDGENGQIRICKIFNNINQLKECLELAKKNPKYYYEISADYTSASYEIQISEDLEIPENAMVAGYDNCTFKVNKGCTLTNYGVMYMNAGTLAIEGTIKNEHVITLSWMYDEESNYQYSTMSLGENAVYTGSGIIEIDSQTGKDYQDFINGFELSKFDIEKQEYGEQCIWTLTLKDNEEPDEPIENPFTDVPASEYYTEPVLWAVDQGITSGLKPNQFAPEDACTRGQVVTFLWRAKGCPEPTTTTHNFTDLKENEYYYKAVLWAVENGITSGLTKTTFGPDETVTRGQFVTFLHRAEGKPAYTVNNPFTDLKTGEYYYDAVLWAVENGVTSGLKPTLFGPDEPCTRGQVVTFLYRAYAE